MKRVLLIVAAVLLLLLLGGGGYLYTQFFVNHGINFDFNPSYVAASEARMWKAYYEGKTTALGMELVKLLNEQFGLTAFQSARLGKDLGNTAMLFASLREDYEAKVLPGLLRYYTEVRELSGGNFNPEEVARAELAWWMARRTPGQDAPENVGRLIGELYAKLYGSSNEHIERAGLLRAQAAGARDQTYSDTDWQEIEAMLVESYTELYKGIAHPVK